VGWLEVMKVNVWGRMGVLGAVCALAVIGPMTTAAQASTTTVFNLNGTYDVGGPARPVISNVNDVLSVDMSAFGRPNAFGTVIATDLIRVTFPDDATYGAVLVAPGTIRWSNGTEWRRMPPVPNVRGRSEATAKQILSAAGFVGFVNVRPIDVTCTRVGLVSSQNPAPGTPALTGTVVLLSVLRAPPDGCEIE